MHNLEQSVRVVFQMFQNLRLFTISSDIEHARLVDQSCQRMLDFCLAEGLYIFTVVHFVQSND